MNRKNSFISLGQTEAVRETREEAKKEIAAIESSDLPKEEKASKIKQIEDLRDDELKRLNSAHILWGTK